MLKIDENLLIEIGLGSLPPAEKNRMLAQIYETLELRVGMTLARQMSNEQLDEFEQFIDSNDEAGALQWLEANFPDYKKVVAAELEKLKNEIQKDAAQILEMVQAGGIPAQAAASPAPQQANTSAPAQHAAPYQPPMQPQSQQPQTPQSPMPAPQQHLQQPTDQAHEQYPQQ